jgi:hypothetical protein
MKGNKDPLSANLYIISGTKIKNKNEENLA